ncbi:MAG TPA: DUF72 domain-containing protein [Noviherbaspirillum sp.]|uniref:DUF72 domain-containing protein n=1 Tax=Noviherbaspirillum sp. TaxID=1926288 RepID=UPI002DDCC6DF|nr:DUF72 domain-containing protein [Noviherbaspirillum sp.]HEV2611934.1 DUF72 domain-containing protein [Noviherbaspirillum sp.]
MQTTIDLFPEEAPIVSEASSTQLLIGCAGWSVPSAAGEKFPAEGSHLERYAAVMPAVEINTSFYRPHKPATYVRWRDSVPESFRFSVKVPKRITHELRMKEIDADLRRFMEEAGHLEHKLGCLLVQLPPSLRYDAPSAGHFFDLLHTLTQADVVCEPRHATWFAADAASMLEARNVSYVIADPQAVEAPPPDTGAGMVYIRLHGSPHMYYSPYSDAYLDQLHADIARKLQSGRRVWCIFDNTAEGHAVPNALSLLSRFG